MHDVLVGAGANNRVRFGNRREKLLLKMKGKAARENQVYSLISKHEKGANRLVSCVRKETGGVHDNKRGIVLIGTDAIARLSKESHHVFSVNTIFFAAQVGEGDLGFRHWLSSGLSRCARHLCVVKPSISLGRGRIGL